MGTLAALTGGNATPTASILTKIRFHGQQHRLGLWLGLKLMACAIQFRVEFSP
jgi:hypothetical protein